MGFKETIQNAIKTGVAAAAALVSVIVLLAGSVQVCLCDPDPDNCGRQCHVCEDESPSLLAGVQAQTCLQVYADESFATNVLLLEEEGTLPEGGAAFHHEEHPCNHVTLALGDQLSVSTDVPVPLVGNFPTGAWILMASTSPPRWRRPSSTAPPDSSGGCYLLNATRIHPLA